MVFSNAPIFRAFQGNGASAAFLLVLTVVFFGHVEARLRASCRQAVFYRVPLGAFEGKTPMGFNDFKEMT